MHACPARQGWGIGAAACSARRLLRPEDRSFVLPATLRRPPRVPRPPCRPPPRQSLFGVNIFGDACQRANGNGPTFMPLWSCGLRVDGRSACGAPGEGEGAPAGGGCQPTDSGFFACNHMQRARPLASNDL